MLLTMTGVHYVVDLSQVHIKEQVDKNSWKKKVTTWETSAAQPMKKGLFCYHKN